MNTKYWRWGGSRWVETSREQCGSLATWEWTMNPVQPSPIPEEFFRVRAARLAQAALRAAEALPLTVVD